MAMRTTDQVPERLPHWELHIPMNFDKVRLKQLMGPNIAPRGMLLRTMYGNMYNSEGSEYHQDVKINSYSGSLGWQNDERYSKFVSSADNTYLGIIFPILIRRFERKSKYEK